MPASLLTPTTAIATPTEMHLSEQGSALVREAQGLQIVDDASFQRGAELFRTAKAFIARVDEVMDPIRESAHKTWKTAVDKQKQLKAPAEQVVAIFGGADGRLSTYEQEVEQRRQDAEAIARAERVRLEAEALLAAQTEEARLRAEAETALLEAAAQAEAAGDLARAARIIETPVIAPRVTPTPVFTPPLAVARPQAAGVSFRDEWDFEITNPALIPREYLLVDTVKLRGVVRALKQATHIPGIRVVRKRITVGRPA
jgi:hypothetical protein